MPADCSSPDAVNISTSPGEAWTLLDISHGNAARFGVPTDVIRYSRHTDGQHFSEFVYSAMPAVDGFLYSSRLTEQTCIAIYDRACSKLTARSPIPLTRSLLIPVLRPWNVSVR